MMQLVGLMPAHIQCNKLHLFKPIMIIQLPEAPISAKSNVWMCIYQRKILGGSESKLMLQLRMRDYDEQQTVYMTFKLPLNSYS